MSYPFLSCSIPLSLYADHPIAVREDKEGRHLREGLSWPKIPTPPEERESLFTSLVPMPFLSPSLTPLQS